MKDRSVVGTVGALLLMTGLCACTKTKPSPTDSSAEVLVVRVESPSPESPGAEHCHKEGKSCVPLAAQQKLPAQGTVRTFAGGRVSLDFGGGRRLDLDSLSQIELGPHRAKLMAGDFTVDSVPLITREPVSPLAVEAGGQTFVGKSHTPTKFALSVREGDTLATVHRGALDGLEISGDMARAGQSIRLTQGHAYRTSPSGSELPALAPLLAEPWNEAVYSDQRATPRGLGTMSARLPGSEQIREGVHLKRHHVRVVIRDGYARTEVEEEFENRTPHVLEGRFVFPVPADASVSRLGLWVGDQWMEGEVLEKTHAQNIYASIVDRPVPRDPALLEWKSGGVLSLKVFPILAHNTRRLVLAYNQALSAEGGVLRYVYPLSLGAGRENHIEDFSLTVQLDEPGAKWQDLRVPGYEVKSGTEGNFRTLSFTRRNFVPTSDFELSVPRTSSPGAELSGFITKDGRPTGGLFGAADWPADSGKGSLRRKPEQELHAQELREAPGHFVLRLSADLPASLTRPAHRKLRRAIVLDVSHSQSQKSIALQGELALRMVRELAPDESAVLLACDSACAVVSLDLGPTPELSAVQARLSRSERFLSELRPGGSSDLSGAIMAAATAVSRGASAHPDELRQVVLMSDGGASSGELSASDIASRVVPRVRELGLDVRLIGLGRSVHHELLTNLAHQLNSPVDFLQGDHSFEQRMFEMTIGLRRPLIRDVRLLLPAGLRPSREQGYPALRLGQELLVTGELLDTNGTMVTLTGTMNGKPYRLDKAISMEGLRTRPNPLAVRLWARDRIGELSGRAPSAENQRAIVALSTRYRTMSAYASFLVLENEQMYADFGVARSSTNEADQVDAAFSDLPAHDALALPARASLESRLDEDASTRSSSGAVRPAPARPKTLLPKNEASQAPPPGLSSSGARPGSLSGLGAAGRAEEPARPTPAAVPRAPGPAEEKKRSSSADTASREAPRDATAKGAAPLAQLSPAEQRELELLVQDPYAPSRRHVPTSHLVITGADDAWRSWGQDQASRLERKWTSQESRTAYEEAILGLLGLGRFAQARSAAEEFLTVDPDNADAALLLAYAAAVDGDHERARQMLDVRSESTPHDAAAHLTAARSFLSVRDDVRACAHFRSYALLEPSEAAQAVATSCWDSLTKTDTPPRFADVVPQKSGHLEVEVKCDAGVLPQDCPSPLVITPAGQVLSPWTPGDGKSSRQLVTSVKIRTGNYFVLVTAGAPSARGRVLIRGKATAKSLPFAGGALHTVAKVQASYW